MPSVGNLDEPRSGFGSIAASIDRSIDRPATNVIGTETKHADAYSSVGSLDDPRVQKAARVANITQLKSIHGPFIDHIGKSVLNIQIYFPRLQYSSPDWQPSSAGGFGRSARPVRESNNKANSCGLPSIPSVRPLPRVIKPGIMEVAGSGDKKSYGRINVRFHRTNRRTCTHSVRVEAICARNRYSFFSSPLKTGSLAPRKRAFAFVGGQ